MVGHYIKGIAFVLGLISIIVLIHFTTRTKHIHIDRINIENAKKQRTT